MRGLSVLELKVPPPVVAAIIAYMMWQITQTIGGLALEFGCRFEVSIFIVGVGFLIDFLALAVFLKAKTTINPLSPNNSSALVNTGIYRFTRNPMYVGNFLFLTAWGLWLLTPINVFCLALYLWYITRFQIKPEEKILTSLFKDEYLKYMGEVRRWV
jgi:protein-S-isoprenylcysteine O-methyltransferase Ste14